MSNLSCLRALRPRFWGRGLNEISPVRRRPNEVAKVRCRGSLCSSHGDFICSAYHTFMYIYLYIQSMYTYIYIMYYYVCDIHYIGVSHGLEWKILVAVGLPPWLRKAPYIIYCVAYCKHQHNKIYISYRHYIIIYYITIYYITMIF